MRSIVEDFGQPKNAGWSNAQFVLRQEAFTLTPLLKSFLHQTTTTGGPPTWSRPIDVDKAKTLGISARIAAIGPPKITSPAQRNLPLVSFATSANPNVPRTTASNAREAWITT